MTIRTSAVAAALIVASGSAALALDMPATPGLTEYIRNPNAPIPPSVSGSAFEGSYAYGSATFGAEPVYGYAGSYVAPTYDPYLRTAPAYGSVGYGAHASGITVGIGTRPWYHGPNW